MTYALDTNTIIHYFRKEPNICGKFHEVIKKGGNLIIPKIVDYELRRGFRTFHSPNKEKAYDILISQDGFCNVEDMNSMSWEKAEEVYKDLYHKRLTVGELDILIASFCITNDYTLVTNNTKHFININNLKIEDWVASVDVPQDDE